MSMTASFGMNPKKNYGNPTSIFYQAVDRFAPLDRGSDKSGCYIFVTAATAITQYDAVVFDRAGNASQLTTTNAGATYMGIGVYQGLVSLAVGDQAFVWIGCGGGTGYGVLGKVTGAYTAGATLNTTATAGQLSSTSTTKLFGVVGGTTTGAAGTTELFSVGFLSINP